MSNIRIQCDRCHRRYGVQASLAGKRVRCAGCAHVFVVSQSQAVDQLSISAQRISARCDHCGQRFRVRSRLAGQRIRCRKCGQKFDVTDAEAEALATRKNKDEKISPDVSNFTGEGLHDAQDLLAEIPSSGNNVTSWSAETGVWDAETWNPTLRYLGFTAAAVVGLVVVIETGSWIIRLTSGPAAEVAVGADSTDAQPPTGAASPEPQPSQPSERRPPTAGRPAATDASPSIPEASSPPAAEDNMTPPPTDIADHAGVLTKRDKEKVRQFQLAAWEKHKVPISLAAIARMADYPFDRSSIDFFARDWFEEANLSDRAILVLVSVQDRRARLEFGETWRHRADDKARRIINRQMIPHFKRKDYRGGILEAVESLADLNPQTLPEVSGSRQFRRRSIDKIHTLEGFLAKHWLLILVVVGIIVLLSMVSQLRRSDRRRYRRRNYGHDDDSWNRDHYWNTSSSWSSSSSYSSSSSWSGDSGGGGGGASGSW